MTSTFSKQIRTVLAAACAVLLLVCLYPVAAQAAPATLFISPATGVYPIGEPFTVEVRVDTGGDEVGTADATVAYNPDDMQFVAFSSEGSIFSRILVDDSRTPGRIDVSGFIERERPPYEGGDGLMVQLTFLPLRNVATELRFAQAAATPPLSLTASVGDLANILTNLSAATYTLVPRESVPARAVVANTGSAGGSSEIRISPEAHEGWLASSTVTLSWDLPASATGMRTGLASSSTAQPTKLYPVPVSSVTLEDVPHGERTFLLQFEYGDEWGEVLRTPLRVDTEMPVIQFTQQKADGAAGVPFGIVVSVHEDLSGVASYEVSIDGGEPLPWEMPTDGVYVPKGVSPGEHVLTMSVTDQVGNVGTRDHVFTLASIQAPVMTDAPERVLTGDTITIRGTTYPDAEVTVFVTHDDGDVQEYFVSGDSAGVFSATISEGARAGTYTVWFSVTDKLGATSPLSIKRSIDVSQPFIMLFGGIAVTYLSVIVPLAALILLLGLVLWLGYSYIRGYRARVRKETKEAYGVVEKDFRALRDEMVRQIGMLEKANQSRELTHEEMRIFRDLSRRLDHIEEHIASEIDDIEDVDKEVAEETATVQHNTLERYQKNLATEGTPAVALPQKRAASVVPQGHTVRIERN